MGEHADGARPRRSARRRDLPVSDGTAVWVACAAAMAVLGYRFVLARKVRAESVAAEEQQVRVRGREGRPEAPTTGRARRRRSPSRTRSPSWRA
ncbi:hypothetical protein ACFQQB_07370 [Nonomuraea rubra]|uniref:hypothetical protein n=1 Tax=Nonomuraea rubra TaxID=46180 RepID=UPI003612922A